jgi:hypothetical protein
VSGDRRTPPPDDPTAERTADQSTQSAGGLHRGVDGPGPGAVKDAGDTAYRNDEDLYKTPRRYDSEDNDSDPVMPADDPGLNTKI